MEEQSYDKMKLEIYKKMYEITDSILVQLKRKVGNMFYGLNNQVHSIEEIKEELNNLNDLKKYSNMGIIDKEGIASLKTLETILFGKNKSKFE